MSSLARPKPLKARAVMRPYVLIYLYRNRLRVHTAQELLAGIGVAIAVALVFATLVANSSVAGSASEIVHAAVGPANLQLRARDADGFDERMLARVERLPGIKQAAPLLEQTATVIAASGQHTTVDVTGTDISLATLNGLAHSLPLAALAPGGIGLSKTTATAVGIPSRVIPGHQQSVSLNLRGRSTTLDVSAVLGPETFGALSRAVIAVMPLARLQHLAGLPRRISRILVETRAGSETAVHRELLGLASGRLAVVSTDQDSSLLHQALGPSSQASALFAAISALLGFLFAFNALLLTVPERRQAIADLRVDGTERTAIFQMVIFQGLCLGVAASLVGLLAGYALSRSAFHQSPGYLSQAFILGTNTVIGIQPLLLALAGGILAACLASVLPLLDLRRGHPLDAVYAEDGVPGNGLSEKTQRLLFAVALGLLLLASALFVLAPSTALVVCLILALATILAVPLVLAGVLRVAGAVARRYQKLTLLSAALTSLRATTMRSLALAATGAVALFGSVALGGSRDDLLRGIAGYTSHYVGGADVWVVNPGDNQAINDFPADHYATDIAQLPGVASVHAFQGSFLNVNDRRVWVIAWPPNIRLNLLKDQVIAGNSATAAARVRERGWITVSAQFAAEHHAGLGDTLSVPTPTGDVPYRIAATTTNFGWSPGAILMNTVDYSHAWGTAEPTALGVDVAPGASATTVRDAIGRALGPNSGLEVLTANSRKANIDASASEGLGQLAEISTLLVVAAILAMIAALGSSIWQGRISLAGLRLEGTTPKRIRRVLLIETTLMLSAGCLTGAIAGIYGQLVIDGYLKNVTGFPVASLATGPHPVEIFAVVVFTVLVVAAIPVWLASRVPATFALDE
jgi:putative ABC transport system permease protein